MTVVTGAAGGIGAALCRAFHDEGAAVVCSDVRAEGVEALVASLNAARAGSALGVAADISTEAANVALIRAAEEHFGPIDLFFANAGIAAGTLLEETDEETWQAAFAVNLHAHRFAAKHLVPGWLARGEGYFCSTASAAGLLSQIGSAPYSVTKAAAVAFADWLSITYGSRGVLVSCLCPQGVNTDMLRQGDDPGAGPASGVVRSAGEVLEPSVVADVVVEAIRDERFLILPHPEVAEFMRRKATDRDRWLAGMRKLQASVTGRW